MVWIVVYVFTYVEVSLLEILSINMTRNRSPALIDFQVNNSTVHSIYVSLYLKDSVSTLMTSRIIGQTYVQKILNTRKIKLSEIQVTYTFNLGFCIKRNHFWSVETTKVKAVNSEGRRQRAYIQLSRRPQGRATRLILAQNQLI